VPLSRDSRTEKKLKALRRAEFRLKQRFEYIDWEEDILYPEIDALKSGRPVLGLEAGAVFDLQVTDAHSNLSEVAPEPSAASGGDPGAIPTGGDPKSPDAGARL
jgi:hypothetical protein